jgi:putative ABC transport system substrate-binding protein
VTRRGFAFLLLALAACFASLCFPSASDAQHPASPRRVGVLLASLSPESNEARAFRQGLRDANYSEGRDVVIEWRSAEGDYHQLPELAADLVQSKVDVIVVESTVAVRAIQHATTTIPIVMAIVADPVGSGLVPNLAHPGGNVTGLSLMTTDLSAKRLQLLKETIPRVAHVAVLWNPATPYHPKVIEDLRAVAPSLSIELKFVGVRTPAEFGSAFSAFSRAHTHALYVIEGPFFFIHRTTLTKLASKARLPAIYGHRAFVDEGGLMSYGTNFGEMMRRSAGYVDKILKGAKPGDLPIEQPTQFELVVNLKTAKALRLTIPQSILVRADEVIR